MKHPPGHIAHILDWWEDHEIFKYALNELIGPIFNGWFVMSLPPSTILYAFPIYPMYTFIFISHAISRILSSTEPNAYTSSCATIFVLRLLQRITYVITTHLKSSASFEVQRNGRSISLTAFERKSKQACSYYKFVLALYLPQTTCREKQVGIKSNRLDWFFQL